MQRPLKFRHLYAERKQSSSHLGSEEEILQLAIALYELSEHTPIEPMVGELNTRTRYAELPLYALMEQYPWRVVAEEWAYEDALEDTYAPACRPEHLLHYTLELAA